MSVRAAAAIGLLIVAAAAVSFRGVYEPDLWYHLAQGREVLSGHIVRTNLFSFTHPDYRQHYTAWLFDAGAYVAWRAGGGGAIQGLQFALIALTVFCLYRACRVRAPASAAFAIVTVAFSSSSPSDPEAAPRLVLGLAACAWLVERAAARRSATPLRWAILVVGLWSNLHVECIFGVLLVGLFAAAETLYSTALARREALRAIAISFACLLATLANPYGSGILVYLYENWSVPQILDIAELRPPRWPTFRAFFTYATLGVLLLLSSPRRLALREGAIFPVFAALGFRYLRLTPLVALATAPMLAARLGTLVGRGLDARMLVVTALVAGCSSRARRPGCTLERSEPGPTR